MKMVYLNKFVHNFADYGQKSCIFMEIWGTVSLLSLFVEVLYLDYLKMLDAIVKCTKHLRQHFSSD